MPVDALELIEEQLLANFARLLPHFPPPPPYQISPVNTADKWHHLPTTHTFGVRDKHNSELDKKILFEGGLSSNYSRRTLETVDTSTVSRKATKWKQDQFVFSYLGVHDPFFARTHFPAFGIFINSECESFPYCHATRRDLASMELPEHEPIELHFLLPPDGRKLGLLELQYDTRFMGSFPRYWGSPDLWEGEYAKKSWEWKIEFHFRNNIPVSNFAAVLWPTDFVENEWSRGTRLSLATSRQTEFKNLHPNCSIVSYKNWKAKPTPSFVAASFYTATYFLENGYFPPFVPHTLNSLELPTP